MNVRCLTSYKIRYKRNHADKFLGLQICRQNFAKALTKSSKECESLLKEEAAKFEQLHHKFMKEKADHLQGLKDTVSKFEEGKERLYMRYKQQRKKEKTMISEQERFCTEKLAQLEESLNK
ncbi:uncharacterized protein LOC103867509 [Brassica rapa]|uniref:uncharacterized protein LOC103867509 n=1 Tax=Brassica campestris TaxID=3711 RepID=UPI00142D356C|nr:uncharacterized protein LOC103867509 [Brassica rapa]